MPKTTGIFLSILSTLGKKYFSVKLISKFTAPYLTRTCPKAPKNTEISIK